MRIDSRRPTPGAGMRRGFGALLLVLAAALALGQLVALLDPAGTQLANDADPFAAPPPWYVHAAWLAACGLLAAAGARLMSRRAEISRPGVR